MIGSPKRMRLMTKPAHLRHCMSRKLDQSRQAALAFDEIFKSALGAPTLPTSIGCLPNCPLGPVGLEPTTKGL